MTIKYAEVTIVIDLEKRSIFNYFGRLIGNETIPNENDNIIILFDDDDIVLSLDDNPIYNVTNKFIMGPKFYNTTLPIYFELKFEPIKTHIFYNKLPVEKQGMLKLDVKSIFENNIKYLTSKVMASIYTMCYTIKIIGSKIVDKDVFAIVKIKSSEEKPRFLLAYDDEYFEKEDITYLANYMFKHRYD